MANVLAKNAYGKNKINLSKIIRHKDHHEFRQVTVDVLLQGDFESAHTMGDNTKILPTDTQKNTVYALAKEHLTGSIEEFGLTLASHFVKNNPQISLAHITLTEHLYQRLSFNGTAHPHAYISSGNEKRVATVSQKADGIIVSAGIKDLLILKTTDSAFENYMKDPYTTLKETADRILATQCEAEWVYASPDVAFTSLYPAIRNTLLQTFASHKSLSVQQTLYAMGEAVLNAFAEVNEISLVMPNKHHILFNLAPFGMENQNEIFVATDEPFGYITGTVVRNSE